MQGNDDVEDNVINKYEEKFHEAINDDLNMPAAMGIVWEVVRNEKKSPKLAELLSKFDEVLGLKIENVETQEETLPEDILQLIEERRIARENKDWAKSDELRDLITEKGYTVKDTKNGQEVVRR